jgi:hypothetical protein
MKGKRERRTKGGRAAGILAALGALAYLWIAYGSPGGLARAIDHAPRAFVDFIYVFYPAGREVLDSGEVVQGFFYTPFFALLMAPLASMPGPPALLAWIVVQVISALALALLGLALVRERPPAMTVVYAAVFVLSFPVVHGFSWGQVSTPLAALALGAALAHERRRPLAAGGLLAVAASIKYFPVVLALPWTLGRRKRALLALAAGLAVLLLLVPLAVLGADGTRAFYGGVQQMVRANAEILSEDVNSQYVAHVLSRWAGGDGDAGSGALLDAGRGIGIAVTGALALLTLAAGWMRVHRAPVWGLLLMLLATPFWVPTSWPHYFVYLPFAQLFLAASALHGTVSGRASRTTLLILVALSVLLSSVPGFQLVGGKEVYGASGMLFVANLLLVIAAVSCVFVLLVHARRQPAV